jgi:hypothetical protein
LLSFQLPSAPFLFRLFPFPFPFCLPPSLTPFSFILSLLSFPPRSIPFPQEAGWQPC